MSGGKICGNCGQIHFKGGVLLRTPKARCYRHLNGINDQLVEALKRLRETAKNGFNEWSPPESDRQEGRCIAYDYMFNEINRELKAAGEKV